MLTPLQNLAIAELTYLVMVAMAFVTFGVSLFAVWTYANLDAGPQRRKGKTTVPTVRATSDSGELQSAP
jgi:hypothetical protein